MRNIHHVFALGVTLAAVGCGAAEDAVFLEEQAAVGAAAETLGRWRGIQTCKGEVGDEQILSSDETEIADYATSKTRAQLKGVLVGSSPEYSCGPLDFDGVVTSTTVATYFENPAKQSCASVSGRALVVSDLDGYDLDQRSAAAAGGKWNLKFDLHVEDESVDGGAAEQSRADITCHFELTLQGGTSRLTQR